MKIIYTAVFILLLSLTAQAQIQIGNDIDGEAAVDRSGTSVCMPDANTLAIGAIFNDGNGSYSGHVRIYSRSGNNWTQKGADIDGESSSNWSGYSISMPDSNLIAIGAPYNDQVGINAGHVRVYSWNGSVWTKKGGDIDGEAQTDHFGSSVSMPDAKTLAIGAPLNGGQGASAGHVRVFSWVGSSWVQKGGDIDGEAQTDHSGSAVSMPDSNTVAIGAPNNDGTGRNAGHVRVYYWNGSSWSQKGTDIDGEAADDYSGSSVSMPDSNTIAIGAIDNDGTSFSAGHVRIYSWRNNSWIQKGSDIDGEAAGDESGYSVSMPDSNTIAIGAIDNDGNGSNSGHVRIYSWNGNLWVQNGTDIDGEAIDDESGYSVCMPNSKTVAIGAPLNDGNGNEAGHVRVFCLPPTRTISAVVCNSYTSPSNRFTWTTSGTYKDTIPNAAGCDSIITINLTVNSSRTTINPVICDTYTSPSGNYTWSTSGNYMDTIPNTAGCDSIITINLTIDTISTIVNIANDSLIANDTSASYQWLDCNNNYAVISGATNRIYRPTVSGNYAVALNKLGCLDTSACNNIIITGLQSSSIQKQTINVYPNPTNGLFTIDSPFSYKSKIYTITDINGKTVQEGLLSKQQTLVNLSELSGGIYFLRIEDKAVKIVLD